MARRTPGSSPPPPRRDRPANDKGAPAAASGGIARLVRRLIKRVGGTFLTGLLAILPLIVTVSVVMWVVDLIVTYLGPQTLLGQGLAAIGLGVSPNGGKPYLLGWVVVLAAIGSLGVVLQLGARSVVSRWIDAGFRKIPLIGAIYGTSRQVTDLFDRKDDQALKGMTAVFCFYGGAGDLGLLGLLVSPERYRIAERDYQIVIIPTAPVPFGGALFYVPAERIVPAGVSVDALMSIYVSMGVTAKEFMSRDGKPRILPESGEG